MNFIKKRFKTFPVIPALSAGWKRGSSLSNHVQRVLDSRFASPPRGGNDNRGFASFEFIWTMPVFALLIILFSDLFHLFNYSARTMIDLRYSAFSNVGQINKTKETGYSETSSGLIYRGETTAVQGGRCRGMATCDSTGEQYSLYVPQRRYPAFGREGNKKANEKRGMEFHFDLPPMR